MPRGQRRAEILEVAEKLFASGRFHEVTLDDIAREAKVGKGTIYRYFKDKDDLFFQTLTVGFDELCGLLERNIPESAPFEEQLLSACRQIHAFFEGRRPTVQMMAGQENRLAHRGRFRQRFSAHRERLDAAIAAIIARGVAEGKVRRDIPPILLARILMGMQRVWVRDTAGVPTRLRNLEVVHELFLSGARPRRDGGPKRGGPE